MEAVSSYEAKTHLSELLSRTAKGEQITITKHGVPVAILVPAGELRKRDFKSVIQEIKEFRGGRTLGEINLKDLIEEGRRF